MLTSKDINRAQQWFDRRGKIAVCLCRMVPGVRTLISIPAGINRMNFMTYLLLTVAGTGIWVGVLAWLGQFLGQNYENVSAYINPISYVVLGGLLVWYAVYIIKRKKAKKS